MDDTWKSNEAFTKSKVKCDWTDVEDVMAYNGNMNNIYRQCCRDEDHVWKFRQILSHQDPLGSRYNLEIGWKNGDPSVCDPSVCDPSVCDPSVLRCYRTVGSRDPSVC